MDSRGERPGLPPFLRKRPSCGQFAAPAPRAPSSPPGPPLSQAGLGAVPAGEVSVATHPLVSGCWNPHDPNTARPAHPPPPPRFTPCPPPGRAPSEPPGPPATPQVAVVTGTSVQLVDLRSRARAGGSERAHAMPARDVDFNPKRQHLVVTAGDDCRVRFWDDRNWSGPVLDLVRAGRGGSGRPRSRRTSRLARPWLTPRLRRGRGATPTGCGSRGTTRSTTSWSSCVRTQPHAPRPPRTARQRRQPPRLAPASRGARPRAPAPRPAPRPQSAGSDTQVLLWRADALSSAAGANSAEVTQPVPHAASADAQVCVYDEHEDSVYSVVRGARRKPLSLSSRALSASLGPLVRALTWWARGRRATVRRRGAGRTRGTSRRCRTTGACPSAPCRGTSSTRCCSEAGEGGREALLLFVAPRCSAAALRSALGGPPVTTDEATIGTAAARATHHEEDHALKTSFRLAACAHPPLLMWPLPPGNASLSLVGGSRLTISTPSRHGDIVKCA